MAKRKRLTPAQSGFLSPAAPAPAARPPIAQVAGEAAALSALDEMRSEWDTARANGRLVLSLPLESIKAGHLIRDRAGLDDEAMGALRRSLQARGQQTPIEVVDLGGGQYGLISGWRRLTALQALWTETQDSRFAQVQALVRQPQDQAAAYVAMVEENEIRSDLSHYERARIVAKALEAGVFETEKQALNSLFASASYAKRSKIKSMLPLVAALDGVLRFPQAVTERQGLAWAKGLGADPAAAERARTALSQAVPQDAGAEALVIGAALAPAPTAVSAPSPAAKTDPAPSGEVRMRTSQYRVELTGLGVDGAFVARLKAWLETQS